MKGREELGDKVVNTGFTEDTAGQQGWTLGNEALVSKNRLPAHLEPG